MILLYALPASCVVQITRYAGSTASLVLSVILGITRALLAVLHPDAPARRIRGRRPCRTFIRRDVLGMGCELRVLQELAAVWSDGHCVTH